jgi:RHS repeat-associated protein
VSASFQYDAIGRRTGKTMNGVTTTFLYDGENIIREQVSGSDTTNLLTGPIDVFYSRTDSTESVSPLFDALGSIIALTDSSGTIQTRYSYGPFGATSSSGAASSNSQSFTGRENDDVDLYFYRARYYSPAHQRFLSEDPIGFEGGDSNLYGYVGNAPVDQRDAFGLQRSEMSDDRREIAERRRKAEEEERRRCACKDIGQENLALAREYKNIMEGYEAAQRTIAWYIKVFKWAAPTNSLTSTAKGIFQGAKAGGVVGGVAGGLKGMFGGGVLSAGVGIGTAMVPLYDVLVGSEGWLIDRVNLANDVHRCATIRVSVSMFQAPWGDGNYGLIRDAVRRAGLK